MPSARCPVVSQVLPLGWDGVVVYWCHDTVVEPHSLLFFTEAQMWPEAETVLSHGPVLPVLQRGKSQLHPWLIWGRAETW